MSGGPLDHADPCGGKDGLGGVSARGESAGRVPGFWTVRSPKWPRCLRRSKRWRQLMVVDGKAAETDWPGATTRRLGHQILKVNS